MNQRIFLLGATMAFIANSVVRMALFWFAGTILGMEKIVPLIGVCLFLPSIFLTPLVSWLIDSFNNRNLSLFVQAISAVAFVLVATIENLDFSPYLLVPLALVFSVSAAYNKSYVYSLAKHNYDDVEPVIIRLNIISTSMMVVSPALVGIPLMFESIPFLSLFYLSAACHVFFMPIIWFAKDSQKRKLSIGQYFSYTYQEIANSQRLKSSFCIFLLTNFSFGAIAVSLPLLISAHFGAENGGDVYSKVEIIGGVASIIVSRWFKIFEQYNTAISISALLVLAISFYQFNVTLLILLSLTVFPYSVLQMIKTQISFFKDTPADLGAGLRGLLTIGQALAASVSCGVVYLLVDNGVNAINLLLSSFCIGCGLAIQLTAKGQHSSVRV